MNTYDHTDALRSPMLEPLRERTYILAVPELGAPFYPGMPMRTLRPAESTLFHTNPHTRIGY